MCCRKRAKSSDAVTSAQSASEDFARFLQHVPGCFMQIGNGIDGDCGSSLHNPSYDFNDDALQIGAAYWVRVVELALGAPDQK